MIDALLSNPMTRMLEQTVNFTEARHNVLLEDIANSSTPGYVQRDLSVDQFQTALRNAFVESKASPSREFEPRSTREVSFFPGSSSIVTRPTEAPNSVAFHDRGVRSMEYLMTQLADNAIAHNTAAQLLKGKYDTLSRAISMKV